MLVPKKTNNLRSGESGLTLIECLVAIVVIAATTATIAPMLLFSVATRVQNQKTEQALQLAQAEMDKVRLIVEQGGDYGDLLFTNAKLLAAPPATTSIALVAAPTAPTDFISNTASVTSVTQARRVDIDNDGDNDFAIQLFRTQGIEVGPQTGGVTRDTPIVFDIGVRVYDARAELSSLPLLTDEAALTFTSGEGERGRQPLAVLYSQIAQGDRNGSLCQYRQFTGSTLTGMQC